MSAIPTPNPAENPLEPQFEQPAPPPPTRDQLSGHEYDGIQEYDNPTPGWWTAIFAATVVFSFFYFVYYHSGVPERSIYDDLAQTKAVEAKKTLARLGITELTVTEPNMIGWTTRPEFIDYGQNVFKANCVSCHGPNGEGKVGPNLTDDYYKHVQRVTDINRVVANGANNGAMPAQATKLSQVDIALVSAYVATLRGKDLPSPPDIQGGARLGTVIAPWPKAPAGAASTRPARQ